MIDDGSTDGTLDVVLDLRRIDPRIRCVSQNNTGQAIARNRAMDMASGEITMFLDADDWFHEDAVSSVVCIFKTAAVDHVIFACAKYYTLSDSWSSGSDDFYWNSLGSDSVQPERVMSVPEYLVLYPLPQMKAFSTSFLTRNKLRFQEGVKYEDNSFHLNVFLSNPRTLFLKKRLQAWRLEREGQTTSRAYSHDCLEVLDAMFANIKKVNTEARTFMLIAMARLATSVAMVIASKDRRFEFLSEALLRFDAHIDQSVIKTLVSLCDEKRIHPGDLVLALSFLGDPRIPQLLVASGVKRHAGISLAIAGASAHTRSLSFGFGVRRWWRMMNNYANGRGEAKVIGLS